MQDINELRNSLKQLASEQQSLRVQISTMCTRRNELDEIINQANTALSDRAHHWQEENNLKARREAAKLERAKIAQKLQTAERNGIALSERERYYREALCHAEYLSTTAADIQADMEAALAEVREADARLSRLNNERADLEEKREEAERGGDTVQSAEGELTDARVSMDQQKAQSFINGRGVDLAPYNTRIAKAEKRLIEAKHNTDAGLAALPIIAARLESLTTSLGTVREAREAAIKRYWLAHTRLFEIEYRQQVEGLIEIANTLMALDQKTGRRLGYRLYGALRALLVPTTADSDFPQPVKLAECDASTLLKRLESELAVALLAEEETA